MADRWRITFDDDNLDDEYDERPSEFLIRQTQYACPDTPIRVWRLIDGWDPELVEERPPLTAGMRTQQPLGRPMEDPTAEG